MTVDNYKQVKEKFVTYGAKEAASPIHMDELKQLYRDEEAQLKSDKLASEYRANPEVLRRAYNTITSNRTTEIEELKAEIERLKGTNDDDKTNVVEVGLF